MTTKQFSILIAVVLLGLVIGLPVVSNVYAQSYGAMSYLPIAPAVSNCPPGIANGTTLCTVGTTSGPYTIYVSYNAGAYQPLIGAGVTITGAAPIVVSGGAVSCPTCVTSAVTSFNGRTGAVTLSKADVVATNLSVTTSVTSTATSAVQ